MNSSKKIRICDAAVKALEILGQASSLDEIFNVIMENNLYNFGAKNPKNVLYIELLRRCINIDDISKPYKKKMFIKLGNKFDLLNIYKNFI